MRVGKLCWKRVIVRIPLPLRTLEFVPWIIFLFFIFCIVIGDFTWTLIPSFHYDISFAKVPRAGCEDKCFVQDSLSISLCLSLHLFIVHSSQTCLDLELEVLLSNPSWWAKALLMMMTTLYAWLLHIRWTKVWLYSKLCHPLAFGNLLRFFFLGPYVHAYMCKDDQWQSHVVSRRGTCPSSALRSLLM